MVSGELLESHTHRCQLPHRSQVRASGQQPNSVRQYQGYRTTSERDHMNTRTAAAGVCHSCRAQHSTGQKPGWRSVTCISAAAACIVTQAVRE